MLPLVWSPVPTSTTEACRGYPHSELQWLDLASRRTVDCRAKHHGTWWTSVYQSLKPHRGSIFYLSLDDSWLFHDAGSAHSVHVPTRWPARRSGIHCQDSLRDLAVSRDDFTRLLKTDLFTLYWSNERVRGVMWRYALQIDYLLNLLTYLLRVRKVNVII